MTKLYDIQVSCCRCAAASIIHRQYKEMAHMEQTLKMCKRCDRVTKHDQQNTTELELCKPCHNEACEHCISDHIEGDNECQCPHREGME